MLILSLLASILLNGLSVDALIWIPIIALWIAALFIISFKDYASSFFWLILINATLVLYQIGISIGTHQPSMALMVGPIVLGSVLFIAVNFYKIKFNPVLPLLFLVLHIPSLVGMIMEDSQDIGDALVGVYLNIIYPCIFYIGAISLSNNREYFREDLKIFIAISVVFIALINNALIPVELSYKNTTNISAAQVGVASYAIIGLIVLTFPVFYDWVKESRSRYINTLSVLSLAGVVAFSFSRGGTIILILSLLGLLLFSKSRLSLSHTLKTAITILLVIALVTLFFSADYLNHISTYWLARLNLLTVDNVQLLGGRKEIWEFGGWLISERPITGYGFGSSPLLFINETSGQMAYSGFHGQFLTLFVERGFFGVILAFFLFLKYLHLVKKTNLKYISRLGIAYFLFLFVLFSNTTGVEFYMNGSKFVNVNIVIYLLLVIAYFESKAQKNINDVSK